MLMWCLRIYKYTHISHMGVLYLMPHETTPTINFYRSETQAWDLLILLIKPVQRVLKYPLLLDKLVALTSLTTQLCTMPGMPSAKWHRTSMRSRGEKIRVSRCMCTCKGVDKLVRVGGGGWDASVKHEKKFTPEAHYQFMSCSRSFMQIFGSYILNNNRVNLKTGGGGAEALL